MEEEFKGLDRSKTYLSAASRTPLPDSVYQSAVAAVGKKSTPWKLDNDPVPESLREAYGRLTHTDPDYVALYPALSTVTSAVARTLGMLETDDGGGGGWDRGTIVVLGDGNSSGVLAWEVLAEEHPERYNVCFVGDPPSAATTESIAQEVDDMLDDPTLQMAVLALPPVRWTDGLMIDLPAIVGEVRKRSPGTLIFVDGTQGLGVLPLHADAFEFDVLAGSVHKWMLGLYGVCLASFSPRMAAAMLPHDLHERITAAGSQDGVVPFVPRKGYPTARKGGGRGLDGGGRPNPVLLPAVATGLELIETWGGPSAVAGAISCYTEAIASFASGLGLSVPSRHAPHIVGIGIGNEACARDAARYLDEHGFVLSRRGAGLRVAPYVYTTWDDVARFCACLSVWATAHRCHHVCFVSTISKL